MQKQAICSKDSAALEAFAAGVLVDLCSVEEVRRTVGGSCCLGEEGLMLVMNLPFFPRDQLSDYTASSDFSYVLKENGWYSSLLFGHYANQMCIARWKICYARNCTAADLPVSITMMDSSLTEVSAVSDTQNVVLNGFKHALPCSDPDWAAINQHCFKINRADVTSVSRVLWHLILCGMVPSVWKNSGGL